MIEALPWLVCVFLSTIIFIGFAVFVWRELTIQALAKDSQQLSRDVVGTLKDVTHMITAISKLVEKTHDQTDRNKDDIIGSMHQMESRLTGLVDRLTIKDGKRGAGITLTDAQIGSIQTGNNSNARTDQDG